MERPWKRLWKGRIPTIAILRRFQGIQTRIFQNLSDAAAPTGWRIFHGGKGCRASFQIQQCRSTAAPKQVAGQFSVQRICIQQKDHSGSRPSEAFEIQGTHRSQQLCPTKDSSSKVSKQGAIGSQCSRCYQSAIEIEGTFWSQCTRQSTIEIEGTLGSQWLFCPATETHGGRTPEGPIPKQRTHGRQRIFYQTIIEPGTLGFQYVCTKR